MSMARPRTPIGTFGKVYSEPAPGGRARAFARFRPSGLVRTGAEAPAGLDHEANGTRTRPLGCGA